MSLLSLRSIDGLDCITTLRKVRFNLSLLNIILYKVKIYHAKHAKVFTAQHIAAPSRRF